MSTELQDLDRKITNLNKQLDELVTRRNQLARDPSRSTASVDLSHLPADLQRFVASSDHISVDEKSLEIDRKTQELMAEDPTLTYDKASDKAALILEQTVA